MCKFSALESFRVLLVERFLHDPWLGRLGDPSQLYRQQIKLVAVTFSYAYNVVFLGIKSTLTRKENHINVLCNLIQFTGRERCDNLEAQRTEQSEKVACVVNLCRCSYVRTLSVTAVDRTFYGFTILGMLENTQNDCKSLALGS